MMVYDGKTGSSKLSYHDIPTSTNHNMASQDVFRTDLGASLGRAWILSWGPLGSAWVMRIIAQTTCVWLIALSRRLGSIQWRNTLAEPKETDKTPTV